MKFIPANIVLFMVCAASYLTGHSQLPDSNAYLHKLFRTYKKTEIIMGLDFQASDYKGSKATRRYFELGLARSVHDYSMHGPVSAGVYLSEEVYLGEKNIYGTKIGAYTHYLLDIGFSMICYTDFSRTNFKLRPEFGLGLGPLRIAGGYNIPTFANKAFAELRKSDGQLTIQYFLPVKRKIIQERRILKSIFKF